MVQAIASGIIAGTQFVVFSGIIYGFYIECRRLWG